jgi:alkyl hydroperoxide reductase subunit AhpC
MKLKNAGPILALLIFIVGMVCPQIEAQTKKPEAQPMKLKPGDTAPDFKLNYFDGSDAKEVSLSQYRDKKNVVLAFYIFAFTGG